ncbi:hypothetical protein M9H77_11744 [Catharanthus roseus]|uniref:Uncharacterized protein n=1 Tax=Catharanthus roseus TaxID=4058 RepID=A0ACC0BFH4_CATRO|nr:hypothetical protein M9H77_11744 [Catharanthus roseus]
MVANLEEQIDPFEDCLQENVSFEDNEDPKTFEEFLEPEEYINHRHLFTTDRKFNSKDELLDWGKQTAMKANTYLITNRYQKSRTSDRRPYITLAFERGGAIRKKTKQIVEDKEEEVSIKRRGPYGTKKCWSELAVVRTQQEDNHKIIVYNHGHTQTTRLSEEQLQQNEQFRKSHVPPRNILRFFREQNIACAVNAQKVYNVVSKIKKNRIKGQNTVEEVLSLSAERGYTVFYINCEESNVLSDIVVAHPTSIAMIRTWPYVLIMDTTYKTNKYNMLLLEAVGMTPTGKNFIVATAFICNEQATTYR